VQRVRLSSCIIILRPLSEPVSRGSDFDYEVLLMKRNKKLSFGGYFAFSGGLIENQDLASHWSVNHPDTFLQATMGGAKFRESALLKGHADFTKKITAIRETFEESGILFAHHQDSGERIIDKERLLALREDYLNTYKSDFAQFCRHHKLVPSLSQVCGLLRIQSPSGFFPVNDT